MDFQQAERLAAGKSDEELALILSHPEEWQEELLDAVEGELKKRGVEINPHVARLRHAYRSRSDESRQGRRLNENKVAIASGIALLFLGIAVQMAAIWYVIASRSAPTFYGAILWLSFVATLYVFLDFYKSGNLNLFPILFTGLVPAFLIWTGLRLIYGDGETKQR